MHQGGAVLLLGILMGMLGCCTDEQLIAMDLLIIAQIPEGELEFELLDRNGSVEWSCTSFRREPGCQATVVDEEWLLSFPDGSRYTSFQAWEGEALLLGQNLTWTEQEDRSGGPVCGDDLAWLEARVNLGAEGPN